MRTRLQWTARRCREHDAFRALCFEAAQLNRGNYVTDRIARCIKLAERLTRFGDGNTSFMQFLTDLAIADRTAHGCGRKTKKETP